MIQRKQQELSMRLLSYLKPHWHIFALGVVGMILYAATETAIPLILKELLDGSFANSGNNESPHRTPLLLVGLFVARGITDYIHTTALAAVANKVVLDLRTQMFDKLLKLPTSYFDDTTRAAVMSRFTYNTQQISPIITVSLITLVKDTLTVIGLLGYMLWMNWQLALAFFTVLPLIGWCIRSVSRRLRALSHSQQSTMGNLTHVLNESIGAQKEIRIFAGETYETKRFFDTTNAIRQYNMKVVATAAANGPIVQTIAVLALAAIVYYASLQSGADQLTVGGFVSFFGAMALLLSPLKRLSNVNENLQRGLAAANTVFDFLDTPSETDTGQLSLARAKGDLHFHNVSFNYPDAPQASLKNIDLQIKAGETVALVGASGSGKSTLMSLIPRFYNVSEGQITLDGINIQDLSLQALRANIGLVTQNVVLFDDTIAANIAYGNDQATESDIRHAAQAANAVEFIDALPEGLQTKIGENGSRLSGGQRQRLSIARALLKDAPILLLDEATSALDTESERAVQVALDNARNGRTTLVIAHRLSTIVNADRIVVLSNGHIIEVGTHQELLDAQGAYSQLYAMQFAS